MLPAGVHGAGSLQLGIPRQSRAFKGGQVRIRVGNSGPPSCQIGGPLRLLLVREKRAGKVKGHLIAAFPQYLL